MNCGCQEKTILYFYGELPEHDAAGAKKHAEACASCAGTLSMLKTLADDFDSCLCQAPELSAEELMSASRAAPLLERLSAGFGRVVAAGVFTVFFLLVFQAAGARRGPAASPADIDPGLDIVEEGIYNLREDISYSAASDFEYKYADIEAQKEQVI